MNENKGLILLADDDIDLVETMKIVLESDGFRVAVAYDTETAFKMLFSEKPAMMILDVMFGPGGKKHGLELVSKIRQDGAVSGIPILMITSVNLNLPVYEVLPEIDGMPVPQNGPGDKGANIKELFTLDVPSYIPVDGFINKPAQPEELSAKVKQMLELKTSKWAGKFTKN